MIYHTILHNVWVFINSFGSQVLNKTCTSTTQYNKHLYMMSIPFVIFLQVKIWFQNKRSKFKKIIKQQGGSVPQAPGSNNLGGMGSPDPHSPDSVSPGPNPEGGALQQINGQPADAGLESPPPPQGTGSMMSSPEVNTNHPGTNSSNQLGGHLGGLHSSMGLPVSTSTSWGDLSTGQSANHNMYNSQYMTHHPQGLSQHYGWGYGPPQGGMSMQPPLLT